MQAKQVEEFEQTLLSYAEMCFSVALTLTRNPVDAHYLTRDVLIAIWHRNDHTYDKKNIKKSLLTMLRAKFKEDYCTPGHGPGNCAEMAQRS
jgi:DNA-directed RNA polymerase specialized sigma24 family protein